MDALATPTAARPVMFGAPAPPGALLPWSWAQQRLETAHTYWIATTRPDGRPRCRPVLDLWVHKETKDIGEEPAVPARNSSRRQAASSATS